MRAILLAAALLLATGRAPAHVHQMRHQADGTVRCDGVSAVALERAEPAMPLVLLNAQQGTRGEDEGGFRILLRATERLAADREASLAFLRGAARWERRITTPVTVILDVDYGPDFFGSSPYGQNTLGQTNPAIFTDLPYEGVRARLVEFMPPVYAETANNLPAASVPIRDEPGRSLVDLCRASLQALRLAEARPNPDPSATPPGAIGAVGFNSAFAFDLEPSNGISGGFFDFDAIVVHEIGHALGFFSNVSHDPDEDAVAALDLYRFATDRLLIPDQFPMTPRMLRPGPAGAPHGFSAATSHGTLPLSTAAPNLTGGDGRQASHWKDVALAPFRYVGIMNPTFSRSRRYELTDLDFFALDLIGWNSAPKPPDARARFYDPAGPGAVPPGGGGAFELRVGNLDPFWDLEVELEGVSVETAFGSSGAGLVVALEGPSGRSIAASQLATLRFSFETPALIEEYTAWLRFRTNDPFRLIEEVPVRISVTGDLPVTWIVR